MGKESWGPGVKRFLSLRFARHRKSNGKVSLLSTVVQCITSCPLGRNCAVSNGAVIVQSGTVGDNERYTFSKKDWFESEGYSSIVEHGFVGCHLSWCTCPFCGVWGRSQIAPKIDRRFLTSIANHVMEYSVRSFPYTLKMTTSLWGEQIGNGEVPLIFLVVCSPLQIEIRTFKSINL